MWSPSSTSISVQWKYTEPYSNHCGFQFVGPGPLNSWWLRKYGFLLQLLPSTSKIPLPGTMLETTAPTLRKKQVYNYTPRYIFWNTSYMQLQTYRTQALILDLKGLRIKRHILLLRHLHLRFQFPDSLCTYNLLIICILLLFGHSHTSPPRILKQHENSVSWHCSCQEISFLQQQISISPIFDHPPMTLQIWSWRNSRDIALPSCNAVVGVL